MFIPIFLSICFSFISFVSAASPLPPIGLTCNYRTSPVIGIQTLNPIFRWQLDSLQSNQTAYQIQFYNEATNALVYDTLMITTSIQQYNYSLSAPVLNSTTSYYWIIRTWDENNNPSLYSIPAIFITGIYNPSLWSSSAIWHSNASTGFVFFRNTFSLPIPSSSIHRILTYITANPQGSTNGEIENSKLLGAYRLYINNKHLIIYY